MTLRRLVVVVAIIGALVVLLVYEHSRLTRAGYAISELSRDEAELVEQVRIVNVHVMKLRQPEVIRQQVTRLRLRLTQPLGGAIVPVAAEQSDFVDQ